MHHGSDIVIADASCLILFDNIGELKILFQLFGQVITTSVVAGEFGKPLPEWIIVKEAKDLYRQEALELEIDKGEASAIALSFEFPGSLLILDDAKARRVAIRLHLLFTGSLGIILKAKQAGIIPSVQSIMKIIQATNFRFSEKIFLQILADAGE